MEKTALFIGGTTGLGLELARLAVSDGMDATVAGRSARSCSIVVSGEARPMRISLGQERIETVKDPYDLIAWVAGVYQEGPFLNLRTKEIDDSVRVNLTGPIRLLASLLRNNKRDGKPCHLIVIGSTSVYTSRVDESLYDAVKAGQAQLARALGKELPRDLPGSRVLLACPGGMATPFWMGRDRDTSRFMDPADVAKAIWSAYRRFADDATHRPFLEIRILRQPDRSARVEYGPQSLE